MLLKTYTSCETNPKLNEYFIANQVRLVEDNSIWYAVHQVAEEIADSLLWNKSNDTTLNFIFYGFLDEHSLMVKYRIKITYEKMVIHKSYGDIVIPENSIIQNIFPT